MIDFLIDYRCVAGGGGMLQGSLGGVVFLRCMERLVVQD